MIEILAAGAIFLIASLFVMLGLGGGLVFVPLLHWLGFDLKTAAIPLGLLLNGLNTFMALFPYGRSGLVEWRRGWTMGLAAAASAPLGVWVQGHTPSDGLLAAFACMVLIAAARASWVARPDKGPAAGDRGAASNPSMRTALELAVGMMVGFVGGLLGIGAGFLVAPVFIGLGLPPKRAAATTALIVTLCSFAGFAGYAARAQLPMMMTLFGAVAVLLASLVGPRLMIRKVKSRWIRQGYAAILILVATILIWEAFGGSFSI